MHQYFSLPFFYGFLMHCEVTADNQLREKVFFLVSYCRAIKSKRGERADKKDGSTYSSCGVRGKKWREGKDISLIDIR